jgi:hypothetical protein
MGFQARAEEQRKQGENLVAWILGFFLQGLGQLAIYKP